MEFHCDSNNNNFITFQVDSNNNNFIKVQINKSYYKQEQKCHRELHLI